MDEEPDYMSDEFLQSCIQSAEVERPGLIKSRKEQREHDVLKNRIVSNKTKIEIKNDAESAFEEGLNKPITSDNKGFLLIQKMGFKPGTGLGKTSAGITDPIALSVKNDRTGLGVGSRKKKKEELLKRKNNDNIATLNEYVVNVSKKHKEREIASDLRKSQRICHQLDMQANKEEPGEGWFWPEEYSKNEDEVEEDDLDLFEKLETLTTYLRKTYFYCVWCGVQYGDEKDMQDCPGPQKELH